VAKSAAGKYPGKPWLEEPTKERIPKEENQTEREVLIQRMVNTADTRGHHQHGTWIEESLALAFLKVVCPSTHKTCFLRVNSYAENAKQALESTLPGFDRDWGRDLVAET